MIARLTFLLASALFLGAVVTQAQQSELTQLQAALGKTDEVIARAKEAVTESGSERARNQLEMAIQLQRMAMSIYNNGPGVIDQEMAAQAGKYTFSARDKAQRAIAITRQAEENEDYVRRRLEKTDDLIRRIEDQIGPEAPPGLGLLLDTAREKQERAQEMLRNRRLRASLQLTMQVEKSLKKALEDVDGYRTARRRFQAQLDRYLTLRERIGQSDYADRPELVEPLKNAERLQNRAELYAGEGEYDRAERSMQEAVEILSRVAENLREPLRIQAAIENLVRRADELQADVERRGDREVQQQFGNAVQHLEKARMHFGQEDFGAAAAQVQAARQVLSQVAQRIGKPVQFDDLIRRLTRQAEGLKDKVSASGDPQLQRELSGALDNLDQGSALYRDGNFDGAEAHLEMAQVKLSWIARELGE